jgi:hypothetical protein
MTLYSGSFKHGNEHLGSIKGGGFLAHLSDCQLARTTQHQEDNPIVAEPEISTSLIPKPATGHQPEPDPASSYPHNLFPYNQF